MGDARPWIPGATHPAVWDATPPRQPISGEQAFLRKYAFQVDRKSRRSWLLVDTPHSGTPPDGTFEDYVDTETNLDLTGEFRGEHSSDSGVSNPAIADYYWNTTKHKFRERELIVEGYVASARWVDARPFSVLFGQRPEGRNFHWLGHGDDVEDVLYNLADPTEIDEDGWYVGVVDDNVQVLDNDAFVPAVNPFVTHDWEPWYPITAGEVEDAFSLDDDEGLVKDITADHHPPEPTDADKNIYYDRDLGRIWVPHKRPAPDTPPDLASMPVAQLTQGFRGVHYVNPGSSQVDDWYYNRNSHAFRIHENGHYYVVTFAELKTRAKVGATDDLFFGADDVFLSEVRSRSQAAQIIENSGGYDATKGYYYIQGSTFQEVASFTEAVGDRYFPDYLTIDIGAHPEVLFDNHPPDPVTIGIIANGADMDATTTEVELNSNASQTIEVGDYLTIGNEILEVTTVTDQALFTVTRGALGSIAAAHSQDDDVNLAPDEIVGREFRNRTWTYGSASDTTPNQNRFDFERALTQEDVGRELLIEIECTALTGASPFVGYRKYAETVIDASTFMDLLSLARSGEGAATNETYSFAVQRMTTTGLNSASVGMWVIARKRWNSADETTGHGTRGHDGMILAFATGGSGASYIRMYVRVTLSAPLGA